MRTGDGRIRKRLPSFFIEKSNEKACGPAAGRDAKCRTHKLPKTGRFPHGESDLFFGGEGV